MEQKKVSDKANGNLLFRPILSGAEYDKLIPPRFCEQTNLGTGDTGFTVDRMAEWVKQHYQQLSKVAPLLKGESLQETLVNVHLWTYWHFQYKQDGAKQQLRSPACAWYSRADGMDCKSFSIVVSSLLLNLGIKHYIRRIKQPKSNYPNDYTHVYVIVPLDQLTGDLSAGYQTIDATTPTSNEPEKTEPKDIYMNFNHTGLNGVATPNRKKRLGLGIGLSDIKNLNFGSIFSGLSCLGGSAYEKGDLERLLPAILAKYDFIYNDLNIAVATGDMEKLSVCQSLCVCWPIISVEKMDAIFYSNKWNKCTDDTIRTTKAIHQSFSDIVTPLMEAYLNQYFIRSKSGLISHRVMDYQPGAPSFAEMFFSDLGRNAVHQVDKFTFMVKPGVKQIPKFEFTTDIKNAMNNGSAPPSPQQYLSSLTTIISTIGGTAQPPSGNNNTPGGNYTQDPSAGGNGTGTGNGNMTNPDKKGIGLLGWTAIGAAAIGGTVLIAKEMKKNKANGAK